MSMTTSDLTRMRATQEDHMFDECKIMRMSKTKNKLNEQIERFKDDTAATKCGVDMRPGSERYGGQSIMLIYDATIRLPIATTLTTQDRIKITERHGETLSTALEFYIVGPVQRGPSGIRLLLKRIEV